ncbi:hypothetical protein EFD55_18085 [Rhizobium pisi]|uniref:Uncharacterized protein n=1 Tax=Rhizobium pisi TaxID=574561 RepID=A0A3R9C3A9_9HYPH|nr:hypothetical protein EFD55_18085 [Rhizobium pisi]
MQIAQSERHKQTNLPCILLMMLVACRLFVVRLQRSDGQVVGQEAHSPMQSLNVSIFAQSRRV